MDILVNNAGVDIHNPIPKIELSDWQTTLDVNLTCVFLCTQAVFENMCQQKSGHIKMSLLRLVYGPVPNLVAMQPPNSVSSVLPSPRLPRANVTELKLMRCVLSPTDTKMRRDNHIDDLNKLSQPEDVADLIVFLVTQPHTAHILETVITTPLM